MDKFDLFVQYLDDLLAKEPYKQIDGQIPYWRAIRAIRDAANDAANHVPQKGTNLTEEK